MVSVRTKCDKIGMWLGVANLAQAESITTVGRRVKERLGIDPHVSNPPPCDLKKPKYEMMKAKLARAIL